MSAYNVRYLSLFLLLAAVGCGSGDGLTRGALRGEVTVGGQPLAAGRVLVTPLAPNQGPLVSAVVVNGKYEFARQDGPVVGLNRVSVEATPALGFALDDEAAYALNANKRQPPSPIPAEYGSQSTQQVNIAGDQENTFNLVIPHAAARW